ncbi:putative metalloprotease MEP1 [Ophiocordyceps camponoti-floridani]|uniref:Putative metalloprotease MEP1 n=1 Tax=Ophiocordyceps camponoti-floridani TaxID=2030778 RepID=A0A8H4Q3U7_9HYPO|nr:putative metalloprotease MEP1 [Ophiocordyceps camponoti-floridani]
MLVVGLIAGLIAATTTLSSVVDDWRDFQISVYAHVYVSNNSRERLSIAVLNGAFAKSNISFVLKEAEWIVNDTWALGQDAKSMVWENYQGNYSVLNMHIIENGLFRGERCSMTHGGIFFDDSCIFSARDFPYGMVSANGDGPHPLGSIIVHGVGHWLGLRHPSQGCAGNPQVEDVPLMLEADGCPTERDSCPTQPGMDPIRNYMVSTTTEECKSEFTTGQMKLMRKNWFQHRVGGKRRIPPPTLKRLPQVRQNGKLPYYPLPQSPVINHHLVSMLCTLEHNGNIIETRESYCGSYVYCRNGLYRAYRRDRSADISWQQCLAWRTDPVAGFY